MGSEDGEGEVVKLTLARMTEVALASRLSIVTALFRDVIGGTMRAKDAIRPAELSESEEAAGVVEELTQLEHGE